MMVEMVKIVGVVVLRFRVFFRLGDALHRVFEPDILGMGIEHLPDRFGLAHQLAVLRDKGFGSQDNRFDISDIFGVIQPFLEIGVEKPVDDEFYGSFNGIDAVHGSTVKQTRSNLKPSNPMVFFRSLFAVGLNIWKFGGCQEMRQV